MIKHPVKQIKVSKILGEMIETNRELYEKIMDSNLANYFNKIVLMAECGDNWWQEEPK
jgi:hypothetical protein